MRCSAMLRDALPAPTMALRAAPRRAARAARRVSAARRTAARVAAGEEGDTPPPPQEEEQAREALDAFFLGRALAEAAAERAADAVSSLLADAGQRQAERDAELRAFGDEVRRRARDGQSAHAGAPPVAPAGDAGSAQPFPAPAGFSPGAATGGVTGSEAADARAAEALPDLEASVRALRAEVDAAREAVSAAKEAAADAGDGTAAEEEEEKE